MGDLTLSPLTLSPLSSSLPEPPAFMQACSRDIGPYAAPARHFARL